MTADIRPLHQRILADISGRILSGEWPPGHRIPIEHELTEEYSCSRMTVNKALTQLANAGLIERRRRSGSFVARPRSQAAVLEIQDIRAEVEALGLPYSYHLATRAQRAPTEADITAFGPVTALIELTCLHHAGASPFCLEERLVNLDAVPEAASEPFEAVAPGPWLIGHVPWSEAQHTIRAIEADRETARRLDIRGGSACLRVERRTWSNGLPVTLVRLTYPGSSHAVVARFTP